MLNARKILRISLFLIVTAVFGGMVTMATYAQKERPLDTPLEINLTPGTPARALARELAEVGIGPNEKLNYIVMRLMADPKKFKAGNYLFTNHVSLTDLLKDIEVGRVSQFAITFPEGLTAREMGKIITKEGISDGGEFVRIAYDPASPAKYGVNAPTLEGYLYPDTYRFAKGIEAGEVIHAMVEKFMMVTAQLGIADAENLPDIVTLASIVEKETGKPSERPIIASVFLNRLKKKMRLETDPTVIYGIKDFDGNIRKKDLLTDTPYNTYTRRGLPPGPIASPGKESLEAVLNPENTEYLYFVSRGDGSHKFSKTFAEHNEAVREYQLRRRK